MDASRYLTALAADYPLLRGALAAAPEGAAVPACPGWTADDLAEHVAHVYQHKVRCIEEQAFPIDWPPEPTGEPPLDALDAAHRALTDTFAAHRPEDPAAGFDPADSTVGFWIRRMAQETAIHRIDAEQTAGRRPAPVPEYLALDGIDELLVLFIGLGSRAFPDAFAPILAASDGRPLAVSAGGRSWTVTASAQGIDVAEGTPADPAATISGTPDAVLRRLWNRAGDDAVRTTGDPDVLARFHRIRTAATQ